MCKSNRVVISILLLFFILSCTSSKDPRFKKLSTLLKGNIEFEEFREDTKTLFIIPNAGCNGCITTAETFVMDNVDQFESIKFIFTGTSSQKALKLKIGDTIYNNEKVFIDLENVFYSPELMSIYPLVVHLKDGLVLKIDEVSPENSEVLANLENELLIRTQNRNNKSN